MDYETIMLDVRDGIGKITLNRPDRLNAFDLKLSEELRGVLEELAGSSEVRVVVITGAGRAFSCGGDVKQMHEAANKQAYLRDLTAAIHQCVILMRGMDTPVIAAVNGGAFGAGFSLALACDIIIASEDAKMSTAFLGIGLAPGCGTQFITELVGYHKACELVLTAEIFTAREALDMGIVNEVVDPQKLEAAVACLTSKLLTMPPLAIGRAKMLINASMKNDMECHLALEGETASESAGTEDFSEGVRAFVEKRKPDFSGE